MDNQDWDPVVGMSEDRKEFQKSNQRNLLFVVIFGFGGLMAFFLSIAIFLPKLKLQKLNETAVLEKLIRETGTKIIERNDCEKGMQGYYSFENIRGKGRVDEIVICKNNYLLGNPTAEEYWRLLAHESTHMMQACVGSKLYGSYQLRDMSYELLEKDRSSYETIHKAYNSSNEDFEIEARWMELQPKQFVIDTLKKYCIK